MNQLIPATTLQEIVGHRNQAVEAWDEAFQAIAFAQSKVDRAKAAVKAACFGVDPGLRGHDRSHEVDAFHAAVQIPDREQYRRVARRLTDIAVWHAILARTDLDVLMDREAKQRLRAQLRYIPEQVDPGTGRVINAEEIARSVPPVTVETIQSTLRGFAEDAGAIWRRGIAKAFSDLDRRFRSHDGFKIGDRVVLSHAIDEYGGLSYSRGSRDVLIDIERVFRVLDGKKLEATYGGVVDAIQAACRGRSREAFEVAGDYFRAKGFKNGNLHLWFTRKDLLRRVNLLLAEWYGETVGDGKDRPEDPEDALRNPTRVPARNLAWFPTPEPIARAVVDRVHLVSERGRLRILEPSAGEGALVRLLAEPVKTWRGTPVNDWREVRHDVVAVELDPARAQRLRETGWCSKVYDWDFLELTSETLGFFDRIVMNPPFDAGRDVDHVAHAWRLLRPGGQLVAIMAASVEWREDRKTRAFRELMERHGARWFDNPAGSFASVGTNVNTATVVVTRKENA